MTDEHKHDAELHDWHWAMYDAKPRLKGAIHNDKCSHGHHPFPNGERVTTSEVIRVDGNIVTTSNTVYKLVGEQTRAPEQL